MPSTSLRPAPPRRLFGPQGRLPTWAQWVIPFAIAGALVAALVVFVEHQDATANEPAPVTKPAAVAEQNREAKVLVTQDQAPHVLRIARHTAPRVAMADAVRAFMGAEIRSGTISGSLQRTACSPAPDTTTARRVFRCTAEAANVNYLFDGVVEPVRRRVTICKRDLPPIPSMNVPVSRRCR